MNPLKKYGLFFLAALLFLGCRPNRAYTSKPAKSTASADSDLLEVNAIAYHVNDSVSDIYFEVRNENLLYKRPDTSRAFYADLKIFYRLLAEPGSKKVIDSSSFVLLDRSSEESVQIKSLVSHFRLRALAGNSYHLEIETLDRNKKTRYNSSLSINKQNAFSNQNFLITRRDSVVFRNYFSEGEQVVVRFANPAVRQVTVDCFLKEFGPAPPPFSVKPSGETKLRPDSMFILELSTNSFMLAMPPHGFYHVRNSAASTDGLTLFTFDKSFPGVGNSDEMIDCTRYIMERTEFEACKDAPEKKAAIDKFWLNIGGSNERARELLKRYYGRVTETNKLYTSYTQGWKTDRGIVYIVFGPPANTYRSRKDEIWVYGNEANPAALRFVFNRVENPFSDNDLVLERSQFYKEAWYTAVEYWRQGNIYLENKR